MENKKFYQKAWFLWLCVLLCPPVGIASLWLFHKDKRLKTKILFSLVLIFFSYVWFNALIDELPALSLFQSPNSTVCSCSNAANNDSLGL